ncbi:hypothetical protein O3G_MSEX009298, partial [Manduca sexta]
ERVPSVR